VDEPLFDDDTQEEGRRGGQASHLSPSPFLFLVLEADRPLAGGARLRLDRVNEVRFVRSKSPSSRTVESRAGCVVLGLPGRAVSAAHARLFHSSDGWVLEDQGSTNGTYVNGARRERALLAPNDVFEIGRCFLMLRQHEAPPAGDEGAFLDGETLAAERLGLATLVPGAERRLAALRKAAAAQIPVLMCGETGTGKEVLARAVHELSGRGGRFVAVNCATLTENLGAAQLFGHVRGAFSGAVSDSTGIVRAADGGTLLLDEVQELTPAMQAALLRVLQEHEVVPVGAVKPLGVDLRVIATCPAPLDAAVHRGSFRPDLFARLSGFSHTLDPVRARREDLGLLIAALLRKQGLVPENRPRIAPELAERLLRHSWPLNVRELEQLLRRAWIFARDGSMEVCDLPEDDRGGSEKERAAARALSAEDLALKDLLAVELEKASGNVASVARTLGKAPVQIRRWAKRFGLDVDRFRGDDDEEPRR
jgi:hypothetical protein